MSPGRRDPLQGCLLGLARAAAALGLALLLLPLAGPLLLAGLAGTAAARRWPKTRRHLAAVGLALAAVSAWAGLWSSAANAEALAYTALDRTLAGPTAGLPPVTAAALAARLPALGACWLCLALVAAAPPWDLPGLLRRLAGRRRPLPATPRAVRRRGAGLEAAAARPASDGTVLGVDERGRPVALTDAQARLMTAVVGAPGSGKTNLLEVLAASAIRRGAGLLMVDGKGDPDLVAYLRTWCAAAGRPCKVWGLADPDPAAWDPLAAGTAGERKDKLTAALPTSEPYYQLAAEGYLQAVFRVTDALGLRPALHDVADLCSPDQLATLASRGGAEPALREAFDLGRLESDRSLQSAVASLQLRLRLLTAGDAGPLLRPASDRPLIDLAADLPAGTVVVFSLPRTEPELRRFLGSVVVRDVAAVLPALRGAPRPTYALYDEASAYLTDGLLDLVARSRDAGLAVVVATQELADYDAVSPALRRQVIGDCSTFIAFRQNSPESAEVAANTLGTVETDALTWQVQRGLLGDAATTGLGSQRRVDEYRVHPQAIKTLPVGVAAYAIKGRDEARAGVLTVLAAPAPP